MKCDADQKFLTHMDMVSNFMKRYGGERYEKRDLQMRVRQRFAELQLMDEKDKIVPWHIVNAAQSIDEVQADINRIVEETIQRVSEEGQPLNKMFQPGDYMLPTPSGIERN